MGPISLYVDRLLTARGFPTKDYLMLDILVYQARRAGLCIR